MIEQTVDDLTQEHQKLEEHEQQCHDLIGLIEDGTQDLDITPDMETITLAALGILSDTIARKNHALNDLIEAKNNQAMDRFIRRQIR